MEGESSKSSSDSGQTTDGTNNSEHDADDNAESVDQSAEENATKDPEVPCTVHNQDKLAHDACEKTENTEKLLDRKRSTCSQRTRKFSVK